MLGKVMASVGGLLLLASTLLGLASTQWWNPTAVSPPGVEEMALWMEFQSVVAITPEQGFVWSMVGSVLGVLLIIPWWRERLRREKVWWVKRDEPLDTPPRAGM